MEKSLTDYVGAYKALQRQGDIQIASERLMKFVMALRGHFSATTGYQVSNMSPSYMDFTYFPFSMSF